MIQAWLMHELIANKANGIAAGYVLTCVYLGLSLCSELAYLLSGLQ